MRTTLFIAVASLLITLNQSVSFAQQSKIVLKSVEGEYRNLDEVKPVLVNEGDKPIYLSLTRCGEAHLSLFYMNKTWVDGMPADCAAESASVEVKPGESYQLPPLVWRPLRDNGKLIERKNFPGKYRVEVIYSFDPPDAESTRSKRPKLKYRKPVTSVSAEFIITPTEWLADQNKKG